MGAFAFRSPVRAESGLREELPKQHLKQFKAENSSVLKLSRAAMQGALQKYSNKSIIIYDKYSYRNMIIYVV